MSPVGKSMLSATEIAGVEARISFGERQHRDNRVPFVSRGVLLCWTRLASVSRRPSKSSMQTGPRQFASKLPGLE